MMAERNPKPGAADPGAGNGGGAGGGSGGGGGGSDSAGSGSRGGAGAGDDQIKLPLGYVVTFTGRYKLAPLALGCLVVLAGATTAVWVWANDVGLFDKSNDGTGGNRTLANFTTVVLVFAGVGCIVAAVLQHLAEQQDVKLTPPAPAKPVPEAAAVPDAESVGAIETAVTAVLDSVSKVSESFAKLRTPSASLLAGLLLFLGAAFVSWQSLPDKPCQTVQVPAPTADNPKAVFVGVSTSCVQVNAATTTSNPPD